MPTEAISNTKLIAVLEQPKNYQNWLVQQCDKEFAEREIDAAEILRLAELVCKQCIQDFLQKQRYYTDDKVLDYQSRFLSSEQVHSIYVREFDAYRMKKSIMNSNLPSG